MLIPTLDHLRELAHTCPELHAVFMELDRGRITQDEALRLAVGLLVASLNTLHRTFCTYVRNDLPPLVIYCKERGQ